MKRCNEILRQLTLGGINSAFCYVGGDIKTLIGKDQPATKASCYNENGTIHSDVNLTFSPNGKRGQGWKFVIALEASDTYTVYLVKRSKKTGVVCDLIGFCDDVHCDNLQSVIERMYDEAMGLKVSR